MKVYIAKDWRGCHVFAGVPKLLKCGGLPDTWSGHELKEFNTSPLQEDIPRGEFIIRDVFWSIVHIIK
jgi:hypothetical protein